MSKGLTIFFGHFSYFQGFRKHFDEIRLARFLDIYLVRELRVKGRKMDYQIVRAKNIAGKAMRKANKKKPGCPEVWKRKQYAMREYKKALNARKNSKNRLDQDYSKLIEWAILATIGLAVLSVSHPQVGILAIIFSILIVAAIMDTKIKNMAEKREKENKEHMENMIRLVKNENRPQEIAVKSPFRVIGEKTTTYVEETQDLQPEGPMTMTEFPYKKVHQ